MELFEESKSPTDRSISAAYLARYAESSGEREKVSEYARIIAAEDYGERLLIKRVLAGLKEKS